LSIFVRVKAHYYIIIYGVTKFVHICLDLGPVKAHYYIILWGDKICPYSSRFRHIITLSTGDKFATIRGHLDLRRSVYDDMEPRS
jgi:hypothetical protein